MTSVFCMHYAHSTHMRELPQHAVVNVLRLDDDDDDDDDAAMTKTECC